MDALMIAIVPLILTGLAFVAYKHPEGYLKIYNVLTVLTGIFCIFSVAWNLGISMYINELITTNKQFASTVDFNYLTQTQSKLTVPLMYFLVVPMVFLIYLQILKELPKILNQKADNNNTKNN